MASLFHFGIERLMQCRKRNTSSDGKHQHKESHPMTKRKCEYPDCGRPHSRQGFCRSHDRMRKLGQKLRPVNEHAPKTPQSGLCDGPECSRDAFSRGYCLAHYKQKFVHKTELKPLRRSRETAPACDFEGCDQPRRLRYYCVGHHEQWKKGQELQPLMPHIYPEGLLCSFEGCNRPVSSDYLCSSHYSQLRRRGVLEEFEPRKPRGVDIPCAEEDCTEPARSKGLCNSHYQKLPEQVMKRRASWHEYHARKLSSSDGSVTADLIAALYDSPCVVCGKTGDIHIDHIQPLGHATNPGTHTADNLQPLCSFHNLSKGARSMDEWMTAS